MTEGVRHKQVLCDQVRVAYGAVPSSLEALPADGPFRVDIRDRARSLLVAKGYLKAEDLGVLPVRTAIAAALLRLGDQNARTDRE
jgi:hypothetical protein